MNLHTKIHTQIKRFKCNECDETFLHINSFKNHKFKHSGEKPIKKYLCSICNRGFRRDEQRRRHEETHNIELKYGCEICQKKFRTKVCYIQHKTDLHGSKYVCITHKTHREGMDFFGFRSFRDF